MNVGEFDFISHQQFSIRIFDLKERHFSSWQGKSLPSFGNSGQVRLPKGGGCAEAYIIWSSLAPALAGRGTAFGHGQAGDSVEILVVPQPQAVAILAGGPNA